MSTAEIPSEKPERTPSLDQVEREPATAQLPDAISESTEGIRLMIGRRKLGVGIERFVIPESSQGLPFRYPMNPLIASRATDFALRLQASREKREGESTEVPSGE